MSKKDFKLDIFTRLLLKVAPEWAVRRMAKKQGINNVVFDKLHEAFADTKRIDLIPLGGNSRGFQLILDKETALYFYQDGEHFVYDGYEMGPYEGGDVTIFDHLT